MRSPQDEPEAGVPVLGYATPDADGLPDWHAEAEALIDAGRSPKALRPFFDRVEPTVRYYARSLARRHGVDSVGSACVVCDRPQCRTAAEAFWIVRLRAGFLEFRLATDQVTARFKTLHSVCPTCYADWMRKQLRLMLLRHVLFWTNMLLLFGLVVGPMILIRFTGGVRGGPTRPLHVTSAIGLLACVTILATTVAWRFRRTSMRNVARALPRYARFTGLGELVHVVEEGGKRSTLPVDR